MITSMGMPFPASSPLAASNGNPPVEIPDTGMVDLASGGDDYLDGGAGNDTIVGDALLFSTFVFGIGSFGPSARGSGGVDTLIGGAGDDILIGDAYGIFGTASGGDDRLYGGDGNDFLAGDTLAATFTSTPPFAGDNGRGGNDRLFGEAGDDTLRGGSGNDILDGGDGMDTAVFDGNLADYTVTGSPDGSQSIVTEIATGDTDVLFNVEFLGLPRHHAPVRQHPIGRCLGVSTTEHVGKATFTGHHALPG